MLTRNTTARAAAVACTATLALGLTATTATADETAPVPDAKLLGQNGAGLYVNIADEGGYNAHLFTLGLADGKTFTTYCVEFHQGVAENNPEMYEVPWDEYPNPESPFHANQAHVNWILHNSFPGIEADDLGAAVGVDGLTEDEAAGATQAAIWHFTDNTELAADPVADDEDGDDARVRAVYDYLTGPSNEGLNDVAPELELKPAKDSGVAGEEIGPLTVSTTAESASIAAELPEGVALVDADGQPIGDTVADGAELFVNVPEQAEAGTGTLQLSAEAELSTGRLWVGLPGQKPTQSMILASSESTTVEVEGTVEWEAAPEEETPAPTPSETPTPTETPEESLPDTGSSTTWPLIAGIVLVAGGAAAVALRRARS